MRSAISSDLSSSDTGPTKRKTKNKDTSEDDTTTTSTSYRNGTSSTASQRILSSPLAVEMANMYEFDELPNVLAKNELFKFTLHVDLHSRSGVVTTTPPMTSSALVSPHHHPRMNGGGGGHHHDSAAAVVDTPLQQPNFNREISVLIDGIQDPHDKNRPIRFVCFGVKRWSVRGDVSIGVNIPGVPTHVSMNSRKFAFTMSANQTCSGIPECLYRLKAAPFVRKHIQKIEEHELDGGGVNSVNGALIALPVELQDDGVTPICPVGYLFKILCETEGRKCPTKKYGDIHCVELAKDKYEQVLMDFKRDLRESSTFFHPNHDKITFTPNNTANSYYGSVTFDIYYIRGG
jgi:hypothetical protein